MAESKQRPKRVYTAPRVVRYGNLAQLTRGGSKGGSESGLVGPKTKAHSG